MSSFILKSIKFGEQEFEVRSSIGYGYLYHNGVQVKENPSPSVHSNRVLCKETDIDTVSRKWWKKELEYRRVKASQLGVKQTPKISYKKTRQTQNK
jgi:hypothetical protein